ncbi:hypothetical protein ACI789_00190 [Geodermatophilus sp. SYSU D00965]
MNAALRSTPLAALVIACSSVATAAPAAAAPEGPTTLHVEGTQSLVGENSYRSEGGLLGDFWILTFDPLYESDSLVIGTGTERFVGCVDVDLDANCGADEPTGDLRFDYVQWATFDPATGTLIEGACTHPVTGGRDGFQGARGLLEMRDVVVDGEVQTTYEGTVVLDAVPGEAPAPEAAQALAAGVAPTGGGPC